MRASPAIISEFAPSLGADSLKIEEKGITAAVCISLRGILRQKKPASFLFEEVISRPSGFFSISRATLIISNPENEALRVETIWKKSNLRQGLRLTLPQKNSLLFRIVKDGKIFGRPFVDGFPGNFIESRIFIDNETCSLAICPLVSNKIVHGLISMASPIPFAFVKVEDGCLSPVFKRFGKILDKKEYE